MALFAERSFRGVLLGLLLFTESSLCAGLPTDLECEEPSCDRTSNMYMTEQEPLDSELYLLQRKAQIIKKPIPEAGLLARDTVSIAVTDAVSVAVNKTTEVHEMKMCDVHPRHSRASAFVTAARAKHVPLSQKQRLSMLSVVETSTLGETYTQAAIGGCCLVVMLTIVFFVVMAVIETKFGNLFGEFVKQGVQIVANEVLGLDITIGSMIIGVFRGSITITDLKVANPTNWNADHFLTANAMDVRLNLWSYAWKRCLNKPISLEVDSVTMKDVNLNVEKSAESSNIQEILDMVHGTKEKPERKAAIFTKPLLKGEKECKLTLHKMAIMDASATVPFWGHIAVPAVQCKDFDKATQGKAKALRPIVAEILREFCQTGEWASEFMAKPQHEKQAMTTA